MKRKNKTHKKKCRCFYCATVSPLYRRLRKILSDAEFKKFERMMNTYDANVLDGDVAQAKLDGSWPGWEWLPEATKRQSDSSLAVTGMRLQWNSRDRCFTVMSATDAQSKVLKSIEDLTVVDVDVVRPWELRYASERSHEEEKGGNP